MDGDQDATPHPMRNIVLIGFMGSGKSTIGRKLNKNLGYSHIDTDHAIEKLAGKTIPEIFKQDGEEAFRKLETQILEDMVLQKTTHHIISTGGGMTARLENQILLRQLGFVVWLSCTPEDILARTSRNTNRPLLQCDDPMRAITKLLAERSPDYKKTAHMEITTTELKFSEISCGILESARYHFGSEAELP